MLRYSFFVLSCLIVSSAFAQPILSEKEALQKVESFFGGGGNCGTTIWIWTFKFTTPEAMEGGAYYDIGQDIRMFKELSLINIVDVPVLIGHLHFRTELHPDVDKSKILEPPPSTCLRFTSEGEKIIQTVKIVRVESVKGGVTKWDGAIVYATLSVTNLNDLYVRYVQARKKPYAAVRKTRILFRYDPFKQAWDLNLRPRPPLPWDVAPINAEFTTQNAPQRLMED
jgi:hypothetical protein